MLFIQRSKQTGGGDRSTTSGRLLLSTNKNFLPCAGSILLSKGGGKTIGKVFQCHNIRLAASTTSAICSRLSENKVVILVK